MFGVSCIVFEATFAVVRFDVPFWSSLCTIIFRHSREDGSGTAHWGGGVYEVELVRSVLFFLLERTYVVVLYVDLLRCE